MPAIHWEIMIIQVVSFLIALGVLWKFAWGPIVRMVRQRQDKIRADIDEAEKMRREAAALEEQYQQRLDQIQQRANEAIAKAKTEGRRLHDEIVRGAQKESSDILRRAEQQLDNERRRVVAELRADIANLSLTIAAKVVRESIGTETHRRRVEELLAELERTSLKG